jgi:hypothetical protein
MEVSIPPAAVLACQRNHSTETVETFISSSSDLEKLIPSPTTLDSIQVLGLSSKDEAFYRSFSHEARAKITRKIDLVFLPFVTCCYLLSQIDRSNIGNAKIEGMYSDLNMDDLRWGLSLAIFFVPYCLFRKS